MHFSYISNYTLTILNSIRGRRPDKLVPYSVEVLLSGFPAAGHIQMAGLAV